MRVVRAWVAMVVGVGVGAVAACGRVGFDANGRTSDAGFDAHLDASHDGGADATNDGSPTDPPEASIDGPVHDAGPDAAGCGFGTSDPIPLHYPWNGWRASTRDASRRIAVRVEFEPIGGAMSYRAEAVRGCDLDALADCDFTVPDATAVAAMPDATFTTLSILAPDDAAPVGARYFLRVRPCADETGGCCAASGTVVYVDLGRPRDDFDGDGLSDLAIGAPGEDAGELGASGPGVVYVYPGVRLAPIDDSSPLTLTAPTSEPAAAFGTSVASGDFNADGFADLAVGSPGDRGTRGSVTVFEGSATGLVIPGQTISPTTDPGDRAGGVVSVPGDLDADGYDDLVIGAPPRSSATTGGAIFVVFGGPTGVRSGRIIEIAGLGPQGGFGNAVAGGFDADRDRIVDFAVGAPDLDGTVDNAGAVAIYTSTSWPLPTRIVRQDVDLGAGFGSAIAALPDGAGGVGYLLVGVPRQASGDVRAFSASDVSGMPTAIRTLFPPAGAGMGARFGTEIAVAELDGARGFDVVVGAPLANASAFVAVGAAFIFRSDPLPDPVPSWTLSGLDIGTGERFGAHLAVLSDGDGDGDAELYVTAFLSDFGPIADTGFARSFGAALSPFSETPTADFYSFDPTLTAHFGRGTLTTAPH